VEDGHLLPHAVDDRGMCMGSFWTGNMDHCSTAWEAQLFRLAHRYEPDRGFPRDRDMARPVGTTGQSRLLPPGQPPGLKAAEVGSCRFQSVGQSTLAAVEGRGDPRQDGTPIHDLAARTGGADLR